MTARNRSDFSDLPLERSSRCIVRCSGDILPLSAVGVDGIVNTGGPNGDASYVIRWLAL